MSAAKDVKTDGQARPSKAEIEGDRICQHAVGE